MTMTEELPGDLDAEDYTDEEIEEIQLFGQQMDDFVELYEDLLLFVQFSATIDQFVGDDGLEADAYCFELVQERAEELADRLNLDTNYDLDGRPDPSDDDDDHAIATLA